MANVMEPNQIYAMLREIKRLAMESSLTGGLKKGSKTLADVYNRCLASISESDPSISTLFVPLTEDASVDEIGVSAALLSKYMKPNREHYEDNEF